MRQNKKRKQNQSQPAIKTKSKAAKKIQRHIKRSLLANINARAQTEVRDHMKVLIDSRREYVIAFWVSLAINIFSWGGLIYMWGY